MDLTSSPLVVMGVSGSGKSLVGSMLARAFQRAFVDGNALHSPASLAKMSSGCALDDDDRAPWLDAVAERLSREDAVLACSALRRAYRDRIRHIVPGAVFVQLSAEPRLIAERLAARSGHFMPAALLDSQLTAFEPLEADERGATVDVSGAPDAVVASALAKLLSAKRPRHSDAAPE